MIDGAEPLDDTVKVVPLCDGSGLVRLAVRVDPARIPTVGWLICTMPAYTAAHLAYGLHDAALESMDYVPVSDDTR